MNLLFILDLTSSLISSVFLPSLQVILYQLMMTTRRTEATFFLSRSLSNKPVSADGEKFVEICCISSTNDKGMKRREMMSLIFISRLLLFYHAYSIIIFMMIDRHRSGFFCWTIININRLHNLDTHNSTCLSLSLSLFFLAWGRSSYWPCLLSYLHMRGDIILC